MTPPEPTFTGRAMLPPGVNRSIARELTPAQRALLKRLALADDGRLELDGHSYIPVHVLDRLGLAVRGSKSRHNVSARITDYGRGVLVLLGDVRP